MACSHQQPSQSLTLVHSRTFVGKRRPHVKSRSGCRTCKLRRVRCDEARPKCRNCERLELDCDGYLPANPSNAVATLSATEGRSFQYFHTQTRPQLSSWAEHNFWNSLALQRSYSEESIRQIVIAIGAFHESLEVGAGNDLAFHINAHHLYQRAISKMTAALPEMPLADLLLGIILLAFLDNIRGDEWSAYTHVSGASAIVEEHRIIDKTQPQSWLVTKVLAPMIDHLSELLLTWYAPAPVLRLTTSLNEPFRSYLDAHDHFNLTIEDIINQAKSTGPDSDFEDIAFERLEAWWEKFLRFLNVSGGTSCQCDWPYCYAHNQLGALFLEILFLTTRARLHCAFTGLEITLDLYESTYHRVLDACEQLAQIIASTHDMGDSARHCLGFRPVYFMGCWMVAAECRDPELRRRAVSILRRSHQKDALYDTFLVADTAECLINREESGSLVQPATSSRDLPEAARVRLLVVSFFELDSKTGGIGQVHEAARCDYIKITVLRHADSEAEPESQQRAIENPRMLIEALWVERPGRSTRTAGYRFPPSGMPVATGGLFPQVAAPPSSGETKLWSRMYDTRSAKELLNERRWKVVNPPIDRVQNQDDGAGAGDKDDNEAVAECSSSSGRRRKPHGRLPAPSTPMEKRAMGTYLHAIVHDVWSAKSW